MSVKKYISKGLNFLSNKFVHYVAQPLSAAFTRAGIAVRNNQVIQLISSPISAAITGIKNYINNLHIQRHTLLPTLMSSVCKGSQYVFFFAAVCLPIGTISGLSVEFAAGHITSELFILFLVLSVGGGIVCTIIGVVAGSAKNAFDEDIQIANYVQSQELERAQAKILEPQHEQDPEIPEHHNRRHRDQHKGKGKGHDATGGDPGTEKEPFTQL